MYFIFHPIVAHEDGSRLFSDNNLFMDGSFVGESADNGLLIVENTFLAQLPSTVSSDRGQVLGSDSGRDRSRIISYKVQEGDSLSSVADYFGISEDTIKWANTIQGNEISSGDELLILPVTGVLYYVRRGDTLGQIAQRHKASAEKIIAYNDIENERDIMPGDQIIIPHGEKPTTPPPRRSYASTEGFGAVTVGTVTQTAHAGHANAVDIANSCGTPIYSASGGTVTRTGYDPGRAGNYIWIDHGSFSGLYAHLQGMHVSPNQRVSSGQQIGTMGTTGLSTGCHLHFETRGGLNPFRNLQRGQTMR